MRTAAAARDGVMAVGRRVEGARAGARVVVRVVETEAAVAVAESVAVEAPMAAAPVASRRGSACFC